MRTTSTRERQRRQLDSSRRVAADGRPIEYRLPQPKPEPVRAQKLQQTEPVDEEDYSPFLRGVFRAAFLLFSSQAMSSIVIANYLGATLEVRVFLGFFPQIATLSSRQVAVDVVTWSVAVAAGLTSVAVLIALLRHRREQQLVDGWACGLIMAGLLLAFQYCRHLYNPPVIDGWVLAQTAAGVLAATVIFVGFRPGQTPSVESEEAARPRTGRQKPPYPSNNKTKEATS